MVNGAYPVITSNRMARKNALHMKDENKTKEQLINEIVELRQRISELEKSETERKQIQEELQESKERYRFLLEKSFNGIFVHENFKILDLNQQMADIAGYARSDLLGMRAIDLFTPESQKLIQDYIGAEKREYYELELQRSDGRKVLVEASGAPCKFQGRNARIVAIRDITERKQVEQEMRLLASIVKNIPDAICSMDLNGNIVSWNEGAEKMLGYEAEEILGRPFTVTIPNELARKELDHCISILNAEGFFTGYESLRLAKNGKIVPVEITAVALKDEGQNITHYTSIMRNISKRKTAQEEIKKRVKELEEFYDMAVGRELRMKELKETMEEMKEEIEHLKQALDKCKKE